MPILCSRLSRLALARSSDGESAGVSSMKILHLCKIFMAEVSFGQSLSASLPVRNFPCSICPNEENNRITNCSEDISMLNMATRTPCLMAACSAIFIAKVVLPMEGLPATMIKSESCKPAVSLSKSLKPVDLPVISPSNSFSSWILAIASFKVSWIGTNPDLPRAPCSAIANTIRSASSSSSLLSRPSALKPAVVRVVPASIS